MEPGLGLGILSCGGGLGGRIEAGRILLGPRRVPAGWEVPGGRIGRACGLSAETRLTASGWDEALWLWAPAQLLGAL